MRTDQEYKEICMPEMVRSRTLCQKINQMEPYHKDVRSLLDELFEGRLPVSSNILTPVYIDRGATIDIGENVFINWGFNTVSTGGITIKDGAMIGPNVSLLTANHDLNNLQIIICKPIVIGKNAWVGEGAKILQGVTVGEGAVVAAGAVVTKDVPPFTIVGGNPARILKEKGAVNMKDFLFPRGQRLDNPNFSGEAWRQALATSAELNCPVSNITFAPGCRNSWHIHPGGQILLVLAGRGWYQEEGKPAQELHPGDVVEIPIGVKHWHGAAKDSEFVHLCIITNPQNGPCQWLEPVTDEDYDQLP